VKAVEHRSDLEEDKDEVHPIEYELTIPEGHNLRTTKIRTSPQRNLNSDILLNKMHSQMNTNPSHKGYFDFHPTSYSNQYKSQDSKVGAMHRARSKSFFEESSAMKKWYKVQNVLKGINLMRKNIVKTIQNPDDIVEDLNRSPRRARTSNHLNSQHSLNLTKFALDDRRKEDRFFDLIGEGGQRAVEKVLNELD